MMGQESRPEEYTYRRYNSRTMSARRAAAVLWMLTGAAVHAQTPAVDFDRDVKPLLRDKCVGCHGPAQQNGGLRLDRRQPAMLGGANGVAILPGNAARSPLVWRVSGPTTFGPQMPPTGPLRADEVTLLRRWIDDGAPWSETNTSTAADTPLMRAALEGTVAEVRTLLDDRADVNARNAAGATALMWSVTDVDKVRLLLDHGADVRARTEDGRTALHMAATRNGGSEVVALLLGHGASATDRGAGALPIDIAANAGDPATLEALLTAGAAANDATAAAAAFVECLACLDVLRRHGLGADALGPALGLALATDGAAVVEYLLKAGAPPAGAAFPPWPDYTPLMIAANSDRDVTRKRQLLLTAGADPGAKTSAGETAKTRAAAKVESSEPGVRARPAAVGPAGLRAAIEKAVALLQQSDVVFTKNTGCISCHHETVPAILVALAGRKQVPLDERTAREQRRRTLAYLDERRERVLQGFDIPGAPASAGYVLMALHAQGEPASPATDALTRLLQMTQLADGRWRIQAHRPPIESSDVTATAVSLRALQLYGRTDRRAQWEPRVVAARKWLESAAATTTEERTFRLLGLGWGGASPDAVAAAARDLASAQRSDGAWSELPALASDAYSTGQALFALHEAGRASPADALYQRGVAFLLRTQHADGSWLVKTRAIPLQVYFETGFPHGADQFISAAATAWAAIALTIALP
jgi:ankyrin repeat protein